ncbi:hypothetical protein F5879DRAFT_983143 [Lentinula edodes]|nr:hypothetical protein F5879DRAFT_983143 [Lentinula edodes]
MSVSSGTLTLHLVHPASPVLLTKNGPLETLQSPSGPIKRRLVLTYLKFENRLRLLQPQGL